MRIEGGGREGGKEGELERFDFEEES